MTEGQERLFILANNLAIPEFIVNLVKDYAKEDKKKVSQLPPTDPYPLWLPLQIGQN